MSTDKSQRIEFENEWKVREVKSYLIIQYCDGEGYVHDKELELSHGEDLQGYITAVTEKDYESIFEEYELYDGITEVLFNGIKVRGRNEKGSMYYQLNGSQRNGHIQVDNKVINDSNKEKMDKIQEILNN